MSEIVLPTKCDISGFSIFIEELPEDWNHVSNMQSLRPLDRSFLFPGKITFLHWCMNLGVELRDFVWSASLMGS